MFSSAFTLLAFKAIAVQSVMAYQATIPATSISHELKQQTQEIHQISTAIRELNPNNDRIIVGKPLVVTGFITQDPSAADVVEDSLKGLTIKIEDPNQKPFLMRFGRQNEKVVLAITEFKD